MALKRIFVRSYGIEKDICELLLYWKGYLWARTALKRIFVSSYCIEKDICELVRYWKGYLWARTVLERIFVSYYDIEKDICELQARLGPSWSCARSYVRREWSDWRWSAGSQQLNNHKLMEKEFFLCWHWLRKTGFIFWWIGIRKLKGTLSRDFHPLVFA